MLPGPKWKSADRVCFLLWCHPGDWLYCWKPRASLQLGIPTLPLSAPPPEFTPVPSSSSEWGYRHCFSADSLVSVSPLTTPSDNKCEGVWEKIFSKWPKKSKETVPLLLDIRMFWYYWSFITDDYRFSMDHQNHWLTPSVAFYVLCRPYLFIPSLISTTGYCGVFWCRYHPIDEWNQLTLSS